MKTQIRMVRDFWDTLYSDVSDHSTVVIKGYGPKRVLCNCSRCRATGKTTVYYINAF